MNSTFAEIVYLNVLTSNVHVNSMQHVYIITINNLWSSIYCTCSFLIFLPWDQQLSRMVAKSCPVRKGIQKRIATESPRSEVLSLSSNPYFQLLSFFCSKSFDICSAKLHVLAFLFWWLLSFHQSGQSCGELPWASLTFPFGVRLGESYVFAGLFPIQGRVCFVCPLPAVRGDGPGANPTFPY